MFGTTLFTLEEEDLVAEEEFCALVSEEIFFLSLLNSSCLDFGTTIPASRMILRCSGSILCIFSIVSYGVTLIIFFFLGYLIRRSVEELFMIASGFNTTSFFSS